MHMPIQVTAGSKPASKQHANSMMTARIPQIAVRTLNHQAMRQAKARMSRLAIS